MKTALAALALVAACASSPPHTRAPDAPKKAPKESGAVVVHHARIWGHPGASALVLAGDRIEKVGGEELLAYTAAKEIDAGGGLVLPGFHDAHIHMLGGGLGLARVQIGEATTVDEALKRIKAWADAHPDAPWVQGRGWSYDMVPKGTFPTAEMLDRVVKDRPAALQAYDGHTLWANTKALALAHVTKDTRDPDDGKIARDAKGNPTGALLEGAEDLVESVVPEPTRKEKKDGLLAAARECARLGITGVDAIEAGVDEWEIFLELEREGTLPLRVNVILPIEGDMDAYVKLRAQGTARVQLIGVKGFVDGVVESKTAFMLRPYEGTKDEVGKPLIPPDKLFALVDEATRRGFMVALHSIGDGAVHLSLDAYAHAHARGRVEHVEVLDKGDVARFKATGTLASMQPYHAVPYEPDPDAGAWSENLGAERRKMTFAWRTLLDAGAVLTFGSDWPVYTNDPLQGLAVAITRKNEHDFPKGGWNAQQAVTAEEAVRAYSEGRTLDEGQPADVVVLPARVKLEEPMTLWGAVPAVVIAGGHEVARAGAAVLE